MNLESDYLLVPATAPPPTKALGMGEQVKVQRNTLRGDPRGPELSIPLPLKPGLLPTFCLARKWDAALINQFPAIKSL